MIIAISGWPQSGKDTAANYLVEEHGFQVLAMGGIIRDALVALNPIVALLPGGGQLRFAEATAQYDYESAKRVLPEYRPLMQRAGTEFAEAIGHPELWVSLLMERVDPAVDYVLPSTRRIVESDTIRAAGGFIARVFRDVNPPFEEHPVEHEMDHYDFDAVMPNVGSVESFLANVDSVFRFLKSQSQ